MHRRGERAMALLVSDSEFGVPGTVCRVRRTQPIFEQPILGLKEFDDNQLVLMNPTSRNH
jgi:hypothetical protein